MAFRGPSAALLLLLAFGAGEAAAFSEWTVRSPSISPKAAGGGAVLALAGLASAGFVYWRRRRRRRR